MSIKYVVYLTLIFIVQFVISEKSFTLVLDTTYSMSDEIDIIKSNLRGVVNGLRNIEYNLLPFNDPDIGPLLSYKSPGEFLDSLDLVEAYGGGRNCPEKSLSAIELALEKSKPLSYIFLFTDATARTEEQEKLHSIAKLCRDSQSQVFIFLSGKCGALESNYYYNDVADYCSGSVYYLEIYNLRKAFSLIREIINVQWTTSSLQEVSSNNIFGLKQYSFTVSPYTSDLMLGVTGDNPELQISTSTGDIPPYDTILKTKHSVVIRLKQPVAGEYSLEITGRGVVKYPTLLMHAELKFQYGFSPKTPRSLEETSRRPIPGSKTNILLYISEPNIELISANVEWITSGEQTVLEFIKNDVSGQYLATHMFESGKSFRLSIVAKDTGSSHVLEGTSDAINPQQTGMVTEWMKPKVERIDPEVNLIDFGTNTIFACKIESFPKPEVSWQDDDFEELPSETVLIELPSTYISYVTIANATRNSSITCEAKNAVGESDNIIYLYVNRTFVFEVLQYPTDLTVEYGEEGKLYCEVNAYPEATIQWSHNGTEIDSKSRRIEINSDEHSLLIKEMDLVDTGDYTCEITNEVNHTRYVATVYITGLDPPEVKLAQTEVVLKPGDWTQQSCNVTKGKPAPTIAWKYKRLNGYDFEDIPENVYIEGNIMKIPSAQTNHGGIYVCEATNILGVDQQEVLVRVQYPPKIRNMEESIVAKQGDLVALPCDVDAVPDATVHWDMIQDDVIIAFDDRHTTDDYHTHRFTAQANDSGLYHCIAENSMGTTTRTVNVNIWGCDDIPICSSLFIISQNLFYASSKGVTNCIKNSLEYSNGTHIFIVNVAPFIEPLITKNVTQRVGSSMYLDCYINFGNPVPSTRWEHIAHTTNITVLKVGHATGKLDYTLNNITKKNEGTYRCIAENEVGVDSVQIYVKVV